MVAGRSRGAAPTRCQATASAIAALGPLADVAVDGGRQTLPSLTPNLCLSRLIQESSGFWYRFQLLRLACAVWHSTPLWECSLWSTRWCSPRRSPSQSLQRGFGNLRSLDAETCH